MAAIPIANNAVKPVMTSVVTGFLLLVCMDNGKLLSIQTAVDVCAVWQKFLFVLMCSGKILIPKGLLTLFLSEWGFAFLLKIG